MQKRRLIERIAPFVALALLARLANAFAWRAASFGAASAAAAHPGMVVERLRIARASRPEDRPSTRLRSFGERYWAELIAVAIALAATAYLVHVLARDSLPPSGDSGQWLTISRYYLGESMPADREAAIVPPVVPVILAGFSAVLGKPAAIVALAAVCYGAIAGLAFLLGRRISGAATAGLIAVILVAAAQRELFELIAVGAYPQLAAIVGMAAALYALIDLARAPDRGHSWMLLAVATGLVLFSHTPSATVMLPPLGASLAYIVWSSDRRRETLKAAFGALRPVLLLWALFIGMNHDVIFGYANVPATFDLKGPDRMWNIVWRHDAQRMVFGAGAIALVALPLFLRGGASWRKQPTVLLLIWTGSLAAMVAFAAVRHVHTDYPRFIAYFIVPAGIAAAAGVQACNPSRVATVALAAPLLLFAGYESMGHLDDAARFYGVNAQSDELIDASAWLNESGEQGAIIGGTRDTKWVQALTGRTSLLYLRRISITRPWEVDRAIAAEVVHRSSGGIESGRLLTTANDGGEDFGTIHPAGVRIDAFHKGMYSPALQIDDKSTRLTFTSVGKSRTVPLAALAPGATTAETVGGMHRLTTRFSSPELTVEVVRVVTMRAGDPNSVEVTYHVGALPGVALTQLTVRTHTGEEEPMLIAPYSGGATIDTELFDGAPMTFDARTTWAPLAAPPAGANPYLLWQDVTLSLQAPDGARRIEETRLYDPLALLRSYGVRYIIDRDGDGAAFPIIRGRQLTPAYENGEYAVYDVGE
jgi:hypothetical protein